ncbi:preprotein translocase subunit YajC [Eubacteriales bacterium OttesenSCG-928-A19]|nr:preprotein translocase subunit YajC [Eubacteriales bacterium OttesenSCG-928-A19]
MMDLNNLLLKGYALAEEAGVAGEEMAEGGTAIALLVQMLPLVLIVVVFYFMLIRPQRKKDKKVKDMLAQLKVGDRVTTIGGIHGTIAGIKDDTITLAVGADKVKLVMARWAIRNVDEVSIENDTEALI